MENVNKQLLDLVSSVLACEIEADVFERHVVPALNVARKVAAEQARQAGPVARDVLMKFGEEVYDKTFWACRDGDGSINLPAIVDRYAVQPPAVPDGYKIVPVEPTKEMFKAVDKLDDEMFAGGSCHGASFEQLWEAAIDAAPNIALAGGQKSST